MLGDRATGTTTETSSARTLLVLGIRTRCCAVPSAHAIEVMRPLPIDPIPESPPFVAGVSIVRGSPTPIVDLGAFLDGEPLDGARRMVTLRIPDGDRIVGLLADEVLGLREPPPSSVSLAPLLGEAAADRVERLAELDGGLLRILQAGAWITDDVWDHLGRETRPR